MKQKIIALTTLMVIGALSSRSQPFTFNLSQMADLSDNVFIGTVNDIHCIGNEKNMPLTVVNFQNIEASKSANSIPDIQYAGGTFNNTIIELTHSPVFEAGERYLIFSADKSKGYANPITGHSGLLKIVKDVNSNEEYLTLDGRCVTGITNDKITVSRRKLNLVRNGIPSFAETDHSLEFKEYPKTEDGKSAEPFIIPAVDETPVTLTAFKAMLAAQYRLSFNALPQTYSTVIPAKRTDAAKTTGTLVICGFQSLPITMEHLPSTSSFYGLTSQCMTNWNNIVNIYQSTPSDGSVGNNNTSEFGGFPSSADLQNAYGSGFGWGAGTVAVTIYKWIAQCDEIVEADIFANPAWTYTDNPWGQVRNAMTVVYKTAITHELGHAWGLMDGGKETYDYAVPTVMQGMVPGIYENGVGVHAIDALYLRSDYASQATPLNITDLGVESYYAVDGTGLVSAKADKTAAKPGEVVKISGVTVENMSTTDLNNVVLRFFLSKDSILDAADYALTPGFSWSKFTKESYSTYSTFDVTVPAAVPPSNYYVGASIQYNNTTSDALTGNNTTFLPAPLRVLLVAGINDVNNKPDIQIAKMQGKGVYTLQMDAGATGTARLYNSVGQLIQTQDIASKTITLPEADALYMLEVVTKDSRKVFKLTNY